MESDRAERKVRPYLPFPSVEKWIEAPFDSSLFDRFAALLQRARSSASPERYATLVDRATRWAAIDTGAIEGLYSVDRGFTMSVATSSEMLQRIGEAKGEWVERSIADALTGYEYVLDFATGAREMSETAVRELHAVLLAQQDTFTVQTDVGRQEHMLPKGVYKVMPNSPLNLATNIVHSYASPDDTPAEMARLIAELRSPAFGSSHPVLQASYAHYAFAAVHPFADGNGRVARALASVYLYRSPGVPWVVFADQRSTYLDSLEAADRGDGRAFVDFVSDRTIDTMNLIVDELGSEGSDFDSLARDLGSELVNQSGIPHMEADALAVRALDVFGQALTQVTEQADRSGVLFPQMVVSHPGDLSAPSGFRRVPQDATGRPMLTVRTTQPFQLVKQRSYDVGIAHEPVGSTGDIVIFDDSGAEKLSILYREIRPTLTEALMLRLRGLAERELADLAGNTAAAMRTELTRRGYMNP